MPTADSSAASLCPHCGAVAIVEPHVALGFRCAVCGGPRIAVDERSLALSAVTQASLRNAGKEHTKQLMLSAAGLSLLGLGALSLLVATVVLLAAAPGIVATLVTLFGCSVPLAAGLWALSRAAAARKLRGDALHGARLAALHDAQAVLGALDSTRVEQLLSIDTEQAELLLAEASIATLLEQAEAPRLRVEAEPAPQLGQEPAIEANLPDRARKGTEI